LCSALGHQCFQETVNFVVSKIHRNPKVEDIDKAFQGPAQE